jgi:hypothetical protein
VISHKDPAGFTIEAFIVLASIGSISRGLAGEGEVDRQALVRGSGSPDGLVSFLCLGVITKRSCSLMSVEVRDGE